MPITITPASASKPTTVVLSNELGFAIDAKATVTDCSGHVISQTRSEVIGNGGKASVTPHTTLANFTTWVVTRAESPTSGISSSVALTSRQGCAVKVTPKLAANAVPSHTSAKASAGVAVSAATPSSGFPTIPVAGSLIGVLCVAVALRKTIFRPKNGAHH